MNRNSTGGSSLDAAEAVLRAIVSSVSADGRCGGPWTHELTPVVKNCGVVSSGRYRVLQVNPVWMGELVVRRELEVLADEMRTWFAIQNEVDRSNRKDRRQSGRCFAA